jgi:hypothetical protein
MVMLCSWCKDKKDITYVCEVYIGPHFDTGTGMVIGPNASTGTVMQFGLFVSWCQVRYIQAEKTYFGFFIRCSDIRIPLLDLGGHLVYVGYIKEPRLILGLCHSPHEWCRKK